MATANTKLITAEELLLMPELECRYELVRGELIRKPFLEHLIAVLYGEYRRGTCHVRPIEQAWQGVQPQRWLSADTRP